MPLTLARAQEFFDQLSKALLIGAFLTFPVALALGNVLAVLALSALVLSGRLGRQWRQVWQLPAARIVMALCLLILVGVSYTSGQSSMVQLNLSKYAKIFLGLAFIVVLLDVPTRRRCLYAFMAAMGFILVSAYAGIFVQLPWSVTQQTGWGVDHTVVGDYITQNVMMTFFVLACLAYAWKAGGRGARVAWCLVALLAAVSITHLSWGRTGFLLLFSALFIAALAVVPGKKKWAVAASIPVVLAIVGVSSPLLVSKVRLGWQEIQHDDAQTYTSLGHRLYNYRMALTLIQQKPLTGFGTGSFDSEACRLNTRQDGCQIYGRHPHNQYLFFAIENGVLGGLLYVALLASLFHAARRRSMPDKFLLVGFATVLAVDSLINSPLFSARESHFFVLVMALLLAGPVLDDGTGPQNS